MVRSDTTEQEGLLFAWYIEFLPSPFSLIYPSSIWTIPQSSLFQIPRHILELCCSFPQVNWQAQLPAGLYSPAQVHFTGLQLQKSITFLSTFYKENKPGCIKYQWFVFRLKILFMCCLLQSTGNSSVNTLGISPAGLRRRKWDPGAVRETMPALTAQPGARSKSPAHIQHYSSGSFGDRNDL